VSALTNTRGNAILDADVVTGDKLRLVTANGSVTSTGTQVTGGSYAAQSITVGSASAQAKTNTADIVFTGMPTANVVGAEIWDSANTTRKWWGAATSSQSFTAGDTCTVSAGALTIQFV
jgi:hypothetical protein